MRSTSPAPCSSTKIPPSGASKQRKAYESRREREFYSYYAPVLSMAETTPQFCDLNDPQSVAAHHAVSSPDKALTAFVQLTALRLRARRSMLFFFDSDYAYVLAEATRSLSLQDDTQHDINDSLWLGTSKIPRGFSVCEVTADLPANDGSNAQDAQTRTIAHIVNNLEKDTRFCDRPFVTDGPMARFYAGVPITTKKGINIGALCVLDELPRDGMNLGEVGFLKDMATTVMTHLEMVRAKQENQCSYDMTTALGAFMEGKSRPSDPWLRGRNNPSQRTRSPRRGFPPSPERASVEAKAERDNATMRRPSVMRRAHAAPQAQERLKKTPISGTVDGAVLPSPHQVSNATNSSNDIQTEDFAPQPLAGEVVNAADALQEDQLATQIKATLKRAAELFRTAIDVDAVVFLDASVRAFEGQVSSSQRLETDSGTDTSRQSASDRASQSRIPTPPLDQVTYSSRPPVAFCPVLGSSYRPGKSTPDSSVAQTPRLTEDFLKGLLRRYPEGRAWHFNPDGETSSDDMSESASFASTSTAESADSDATHSSTPSSRRTAKRLRSRIKDGRLIQKLFPGVRSLILVGLWDSHKDCWFGASILWSFAPTRVLSTTIELPFISAFCDVVLSELWRIEAQMVDRSKNDFISSISHELRSPLHGILGSAECLEDRETDAVGQELVRSILSCGTTLLDIINQLLQYSRLDNGAQQRQTRLQQFDSGKRPNSASSTRSDPFPQKTGASLQTLTEDAVSAACSGFDHQGLSPYGVSTSQVLIPTEARRDVPVILDIEKPFDSDWNFLITPGAWKRICMNLVSNALKYTPSGHIRVALSKTWLPIVSADTRNAQICLTVEDTGVGMSQAFQAQNLFRPFKQENSLSQGTGLGLNLVAKLAKAEGGTVRVKSQKGKGTTVCVALPLQTSGLSEIDPGGSRDLARDVTDSIVDFVGFEPPSDSKVTSTSHAEAQSKLLLSLQDMVGQLGMRTRVSKADDRYTEQADLQVVRALEPYGATDSQLIESENTTISIEHILRKPSVVLCGTRGSALRLREHYVRFGSVDNIQFLWLPIGPEKLATAISACLKPSAKHPGHADEDVEGIAPSLKAPSEADTTPGAVDRAALVNAAPLIPDLHQVDLALRSRDLGEVKRQGSRSPRDSPPVFDTPSLAEIDSVAAQSKNYQPTSSIPLLLVDDNPVNLRILTVFAAKAGYPYIAASNGLQAVEAYKRAEEQGRAESVASPASSASHAGSGAPNKPAVILMDIQMPVMDGHQATRLIRQFEQENGVQRATIIALTGLGSKEAQEVSFSSGVDLFLTKPVRLKELGAILLKMREGTQEEAPS